MPSVDVELQNCNVTAGSAFEVGNNGFYAEESNSVEHFLVGLLEEDLGIGPKKPNAGGVIAVGSVGGFAVHDDDTEGSRAGSSCP